MRRLNCRLLNAYNLINIINNYTKNLFTNANHQNVFQCIFFSFINFHIEENAKVNNRNDITARIVHTKDKGQCIRNIGKELSASLYNFLNLHDIYSIILAGKRKGDHLKIKDGDFFFPCLCRCFRNFCIHCCQTVTHTLILTISAVLTSLNFLTDTEFQQLCYINNQRY